MTTPNDETASRDKVTQRKTRDGCVSLNVGSDTPEAKRLQKVTTEFLTVLLETLPLPPGEDFVDSHPESILTAAMQTCVNALLYDTPERLKPAMERVKEKGSRVTSMVAGAFGLTAALLLNERYVSVSVPLLMERLFLKSLHAGLAGLTDLMEATGALPNLFDAVALGSTLEYTKAELKSNQERLRMMKEVAGLADFITKPNAPSTDTEH